MIVICNFVYKIFYFVTSTYISWHRSLRRTLYLKIILLSKLEPHRYSRKNSEHIEKNYVTIYVTMFLCGSKDFLHLSV